MKIKFLLIAILFITIQSCNYNTSVNKDMLTGIGTKGNGLSCANVSLTIGTQKITKNTFVYGEEFYLNFNNIEGFIKENGFVFPGMNLLILSQQGDTIMDKKDMYAEYTNGIDISPLLLQCNILVADPMRSNNSYTLFVNIWDKKSAGTFDTKLKFDVVDNKAIKLESNNITYKNIYMFSKDRKLTISGNKIKLNETIYLLFEGLSGITNVEGKAIFGVSMVIKDAEGRIFLNEKDLMADSNMDIAELKQQFAPNFIISNPDIKSPINCEILIWDKNSDNKIKASLDLEVE
ncbi:MAG: hypothetical protein A2046_02165 [Bacteroidetes bacterium GWA2_30_7]|nr:MAG: hypothetical protein A2046_02165 [Bacteroidetes bacterium GWA2_30_7]